MAAVRPAGVWLLGAALIAGESLARGAPAPGIGLDLLEIERIERALARRPGLANRLFSPGELAYANSRARPAQHLAARFCAKEAVSKALGLAALAPRDIEVLSGGAGVGLRLHGAAAARARELGVEVAISLTHSRGHAAAVAVLR